MAPLPIDPHRLIRFTQIRDIVEMINDGVNTFDSIHQKLHDTQSFMERATALVLRQMRTSGLIEEILFLNEQDEVDTLYTVSKIGKAEYNNLIAQHKLNTALKEMGL